MFSFDLSSKRVRKALRFLTYALMTVSVVLISLIYVLIAMGYRFDSKHLSFEQGGLIQFDSFPEGAKVKVEPGDTTKTPGKANLAVGDYHINLTLNGYRAWDKNTSLAAGQLLWLDYIRLVPDSITTNALHDFTALASVVPSPDKHWVLLQPSTALPNFVLGNLGDEKKPTFSTIDLPADLFSRQNGSYGVISVQEWDKSSRFLLLKAVLPNGAVEYARFDKSNPATAVNLSQKFKMNIVDAHFASNDANLVYAKTDDVLRRLDINASSASGALATGVKSFIVGDPDVLVYAAERDLLGAKAQVLAISKQGRETVYKTFSASAQLFYGFTEYFDHEYLAFGDHSQPKIELIVEPTSANAKALTTLTLPGTVEWMEFSKNGRMLASKSKNTLTTYDIEEVKTYSKQLDLGRVGWLDSFYLYTDTSNSLRWFEFDGENQRSITSIQSGYATFLSATGERIFSVGKSSITGNLILQSSGLINR